MNRLLKCALLILNVLPLAGLAQENDDEKSINNQYWIDFIPHYKISDAFEVYGDASFRIREYQEWNSYSVRPSVKWQAFPAVSFHAGLGIFYNAFEDDYNMLEIRPWQGVRIGFPELGPIKIKHLIRLEERYFQRQSEEENKFRSYRARYQISTKIPLNNAYIRSNTVYIPLAFEWLASADEKVETVWASENRMTMGLAYSFNKKWIIEFEYMHWWTKALPEDEFRASNNIFRIRFLKNGWLFGE